MRLRQIEVFHAVYASGSVTSAARVLNVSQPSVSKVLAHAEQQLGYQLFDRVKGKLVATPEAHRLAGLVSNVFDTVDQLRNVAENLRASDAGKIRIAATPAFGIDLLPTAVASYLQEHEGTVFEIETLHHDEIGAAILESRIDIGLVFDPADTPGLALEELATSEFIVIGAQHMDFGGKDTINIDDIADLPFIGLSRRGPLGQILSSHLDSRETGLNKIIHTETYHIAKALVAKGVGITIVDGITARSAGHESVRSWALDPPIQFSVSAIRLDSAPLSIVARRFIDHLRETVHEFLDSAKSSV